MTLSNFLAIIVGGGIAIWLVVMTRRRGHITDPGLLKDRDDRLARFEAERLERMAQYALAWKLKGSLEKAVTRPVEPSEGILAKVIGSIPKAR